MKGEGEQEQDRGSEGGRKRRREGGASKKCEAQGAQGSQSAPADASFLIQWKIQKIISFRQGDIGRKRQRRSERWGGVYTILMTTRGSERILKIGQYLTKLYVDYSGLLFWPSLYIYTDVIYRTPLSCMPEFLISAITCNRGSVASEKIFEKMREEEHTMQILGPKVCGWGHLYRRLLLTEM